jgi:tetratricopeptide (TPR) repeat protein
VFSSKVLTFSLDSRWRKTVFLAAIGLPGLLLIGNVARIAIAARWGESLRLADVTKASKLDPLNPEYQYRMGLLYEFDLENMDVTQAVFHLKKATTLQPNRADYFSSLGYACFTAGDDSCAGQAYENSVRLAPALPRYQWEIADYYLLTGRQTQSLSHFRRLLELSLDDPTPAFAVCLRAFKDPELLWRTLLADTGDADLQVGYISFLYVNGQPDAAYQVWNSVVASGSRMSFSAVRPYLDRLIADNHVERASRVWRDLEKLGVVQRSGMSDPANLIFNGEFEQEPLNSGFDWRTQAEQYLNLNFADADGYQGRRCVRVDFTVPNNAEYQPLYQIVAVEPNQEYSLRAYARSADISSESGPRLRVTDLECPACLSGESQALVGTTEWHEISLDFSTGPNTQAVSVSLWRPRSRSFPMEIQGHFWLSAVSLRPASPDEAVTAGRLQ